MANKFLYRIIKKIGQTTPDDLPTEGVVATQTVSGAPPNFVASNYYPSLIKAFNSQNTNIIDRMISLLNQALYYTSNGKINLLWMYNNNFNFDTSIAPSVELKSLMNFSKLVFQQLFSRIDQPLSKEDIAQRINILRTNSSLLNLPQTSASGQLATKIGGDLKTLLNNYLIQIR